MMDIYELAKKLRPWREKRAIDTNSTKEAQIACWSEERIELMDAIGDCAVCIINAASLGFDIEKASQELDILKRVAIAAEVDFGDCLQMAWDEIEHRVGLTLNSGKFTKWANLTHADRLIVAQSGQLLDAPRHIVEQCEAQCTAQEWEEIRAAERVGRDD
jgi:hypothetical protein